MTKSIIKPIVIGNFAEGGEMAWAWWHEQHCRLAIIGDKELSPIKGFIRGVSRLVSGRDSKSVYWITKEEKSSLSEVKSLEGIPWVERFPDPPKEFQDREIFIENRKFFSSSFFTLLAGSKGIERKDLMPSSYYQGHLEGPMGGYLRTVENMEDGERKAWLQEEINALESVHWYKTKEEGTKYYLDDSGNLYQKALSFLVAAWSFWTYTCQIDEPQQLLLIIEPPKELLLPGVDPVVQNIVVETLRILNNLSITTTTTVILASETFYPIPEQNYRFRIFFQTKDSDIELTSSANKQAIQLPILYESWESGRSDAGMWEDSYSGERFVSFFWTEELQFMDEFEED
jgi:hypothetical protein